jgi:uncharacterized membrane protein HdeD (DUF308 family)
MTDTLQESPETLAKRVSGFSIFLSILLIVCGILAILLPIEMSFGVMIVIAWMLIISGVLQFIHAFQSKGIGSAIWKILIALVYVGTGLYLRLNPGIGIAALTLCLIVFFVVQGAIDIFIYLARPKTRGSGWLLFDGLITLVLGLMIWRHWPSGSLWVVGTLVGINMLFTGFTRLMLTLTVRRATSLMTQVA